VHTAGGSLKGVRVLDLTSVVLGPLATQILGDHGADVIKIESIDGDTMRSNGVSRHKGMSSVFLAINRNKRSLAIDLKSPEGRSAVLEIAAKADIVVHNMRVPAIERLGFDYATIQALNPKVVYCAATGFGQDGPYRFKPALDDIIQAACGIASLVGHASGKPDYVPSLLADKMAGLAVASAVFAAMFHRERTGEGQYVEVPMYETLVEFMLAEHMGGLAFEPPLGDAGYPRIVSGGRRPVPTSDGFIAMLPYTPAHWRNLFVHLGRSDLLQQYDLSSSYEVNAVVRNLYAAIELITPSKTTDEWLEICEKLDIPVTRIYEIAELPDHPHLRAVRLFELMDHPSEGRIRFVRPAAKFSASPQSVRRPAPLLGEHSAEILSEAGYSQTQIDALRQRGVIVEPQSS
jgi:formyl-CoA transferase